MIDQRYVKHVSFKYFYITSLSFHLNVKKTQTEFLLMFHHEEGFLWVIHSVYSHYQRLSTVTWILQNAIDFFYAGLYFIILFKKKIVGFQNLRKDSNSFSPETFLQYILIKKLHFFKYTCIFLKNCTGIPTVYKHIQNRFPCIFDAIFFK